MKTINKLCTPIDGEIIIVPIADVHIGDAQCNEAKLLSAIDYIKNTDNAYCILNGDLINNATKNSKSDVYADTMSPQNQLAMAIKYFSPIVDKILCVTDGNHEDRSWKEVALSPMAIFCAQLGLEEVYAPEGAYIFLTGEVKKGKSRIYNNVFTIYAQHGSTGGGRRAGSKANALESMDEVVDADVYIHSHSHMPLVFKEGFYRPVRHKKILLYSERLYVNTNSFLYYGGYGAKKGYKPSSYSIPKIRLIAKRDQHKGLDRVRTDLIAEI